MSILLADVRNYNTMSYNGNRGSHSQQPNNCLQLKRHKGQCRYVRHQILHNVIADELDKMVCRVFMNTPDQCYFNW